MMTMKQFGTVLGAVSILALGACGTTGGPFGGLGSSSTGAQTISAGSAYAGSGVVRAIELVGSDLYRFTIRMDNGSNQTLTNKSTAGYKVGDRVRIENGNLQRS
jgi:outer membrane lipoprotein SlyB